MTLIHYVAIYFALSALTLAITLIKVETRHSGTEDEYSPVTKYTVAVLSALTAPLVGLYNDLKSKKAGE